MVRTALSRRDANFLLDLISESVRCDEADVLKKLITDLKGLISFEYATCGLAKLDAAGSVLKYDLINVNYPEKWLELYGARGYHLVDPVVKKNFTAFDVQFWAETYKLNRPPTEFIYNAEDFGLRAGFTHGMRVFGRRNEGSLFSVAGRKAKGDIYRTRIILQHVVPHLHQALSRVIRRSRVPEDVHLTKREREILKWFQQGKSSWDVSVILGISKDTVNFHTYNVVRKLNVVNRLQAVAVALQYGLIDLD